MGRVEKRTKRSVSISGMEVVIVSRAFQFTFYFEKILRNVVEMFEGATLQGEEDRNAAAQKS